MVDIAIPGDARCSSKEKQICYIDLKIEVEKLWSIKCVVVPIIRLYTNKFNEVFGYHQFASQHLVMTIQKSVYHLST